VSSAASGAKKPSAALGAGDVAGKRITIEQLARRIAKLPADMHHATIRGLQSAGARMVGIVVEEIHATQPHAPIDTGELMRSVHSKPTEDGAVVSVDAPHASYMEHGTRPHFPPLLPIAEWAYRKGLADSMEEALGIALSIARKIAHHGIEPRHYFARANARMKREDVVMEEIHAELDKLKGA
jgi:hypothetical protein